MAKTVATDEYEAHPLALLEEVAQTQEEVVVLRDGKPLGRLVPMYRRPMTLEELRSLGGRILGDIEEPMGEWENAFPVIGRPRKTLEEMRAEGVKILGDIMEPLDEWDMTK